MKYKKVNLIFYLPNFSVIGGAGNSITKLCRKVDKNKYNIIIISLGKCFYKNRLKNYVKNFIELKSSRTFFSFIEIIRILKKLKIKKKKTIFISNINYTNVLSCIYVNIFLGYKLILIERTPLKELKSYYTKTDYLKKKITYILLKILYPFSDGIIVNSSLEKKRMENLLNKKITKIYSPAINNVININSFNKIDKIKILSIGRLSIEKNFLLLIKSVSLIKNINIQVKIIGDGEQLTFLKNKIKQYNLKNKIQISKFNKKYMSEFKKYNLFISTSHFEGFPNVVAEAINSGLPVISTNSDGGIHDILLKGKGGKILKDFSAQTLANEIINFYKNQNIFYNKMILSKKFLKRFTEQNCANEYQNLFQKLIKYEK